ncbi:glycolipid transfer protein 2 [Zea mays]|uniref:Putative glycolipid transfer protein (GLTP) family protein n=1 Tax=Zea mays TaxID=4577 RepID=A0A1D6LDM7_MAIZE|nr:glycolipid transfer protein 2 [Zea mays]AQK78106.1 Putative glycolipid transfer protein (GLTP) family protein [Zea mays]|eukprot:XP_008648360.1 glycolipid transfer protein 2 [Zea mays]
MERKRKEMEKGKSELRLAMEELRLCGSRDGAEEEEEVQVQQVKVQEQHKSSTMDLLYVSKQLIHVLDEIGPTLLVLRQDIQQNVQRLQDLHEKDCSKYACLTAIVTEEMEQGTAKKTKSCTRAIIWLSRSIKFSKYLLERLLETPESSLEEIVEEAYANTLKPWHGWISSAAYKVALKLIPEREFFVALLMGNCQDLEDLAEDARMLAYAVQPLLQEIDAISAKHNLDKMKSS